MEINRFFYMVFLVDHQNDEDHRYLGTAFPIALGGGFLTCRHVVDVEFDARTHRRGILDVQRQIFCLMGDPLYPGDDVTTMRIGRKTTYFA